MPAGDNMPAHLPVARTPRSHLHEARRQLQEQGAVAEGLIAPLLRNSWERSRRFGLLPGGRPAGAPHASAAQLARALDRQGELLSHARPVMEFLYEQTQDSGSLVILADSHGMVLQALGDASFLDRAERVALRPGANWHEQWRGSNAIGTVLAEAAPVVVHADEHYLERNAFLTCTAAPILDSAGRVIGVLDISSDHRAYQRHTLALVRLAAHTIERKLFDTHHAGSLRIGLHAQPEGIGNIGEGRLALNEAGCLIGANATGLALLRVDGPEWGVTTIEQLLQLDLATLADWCRQPQSAPRPVRRRDGSLLWARIESIRQAFGPARTGATTPFRCAVPADALAALDTGDAAMRATLDRARRVLDKPLALLLQGESGVGKEVLARAIHAASARGDAPFVAVNCASLPDTLIEAELFGYAPGAFTGVGRNGAPGRIREAHGGTLFLDEIGDMPLALQARLLRVLQDRLVQPLGGGKPVAVDFRLVCATHRDLRAEIAQRRFREDLYYRLNGLALQLPPLRDRQDRPALVAAMLAQFAPGRPLSLAPDVALAMASYRWPGNLRQLSNAMQTACMLLDDGDAQIEWRHLPDDLAEELRRATPGCDSTEGEDGAADLRAQSLRAVEQAVSSCAGNLSEAARRLGISRNTLYRKLRELPGC
jgi:sigma-54 dependent transcriptional regulator, acetoin dehydrogenase operon transcriptional activator AcoR